MSSKVQSFETIFWKDGRVVMIDQRVLPKREVYNEYHDVAGVADAIVTMVIRGAPAIGCAAAFGIALAAHTAVGGSSEVLRATLQACDVLAATRPTAVNLFWAIDRMKQVIHRVEGADVDEMRRTLLNEATAVHSEDVALCRAIGKFGAELVPDNATILTHCNAGALATAGHGTALGVIRSAVESGKKVKVLADETRPFLQGARLTAWELQRDGIDVTVISDSAAASIMARGLVDLVVVGTDRTVANGDVANKIGTLSVALAAKASDTPFYVAAPWSTIDLSMKSGAEIPIEDRPAREVTHVYEEQIVPDGVKVLNPAFDVTPAALVTAIITDKGVVRAPYTESLKAMSFIPPNCGVSNN
jgi:methylthioribose-1-phosphate isomerase